MTFPQRSLDELKRLFLERAIVGGAGDQVNVSNTDASPVPVKLSTADLAALEQITVTVSNPTANPETGLAKQTTLAAILTELDQKYEGGPISIANFPSVQPVSGTVTAESALAKKIGEGKFWIAGADILTDATNTGAVFTLDNPATTTGGATNTKNMYIVKIAVDSIAAGQIVFARNQPLVNAKVDAFNPNTYITGTPVAGFYAGNITPSGGTIISPTRKVFANSTYEFEGLVILKPGERFSARVTGSTTGSRITGLVHWYEE